jgi:hypothetical protein
VTFKPDIIRTIRNEGIELKQRGHHWWALCPLHAEKTPSFKVDPEKGLWFCFGCQRGGDAIAFLRELKAISFNEACNYLHLEKSRPVVSPEVLKKKQLMEGFNRWCKDKENELCKDIRALNRIALSINNPEDLEKHASIFLKITDINYCLDILQGDEEELKFNYFLEEERIFGKL